MLKTTQIVGGGDEILTSEPLHYIMTMRQECLDPDNNNNNNNNNI